MSAESRSRTCLVGGVLAILCTLCGSQSGLRAEDGDVSESSLAKVPADVAFYNASINLRDSTLRLAESRLVQQLRAVPFVVQLEAELRKQWESPEGELAQAKGIIESPTAMNLIRLAEDMFANEFFVYGGQDWCESIEGLINVQRELSALADTGEAAMMDYVYGLTKEDIDRLKFPTTVIGFRLTDDENARVQLDALEGIVRYGLGNVDELRDLISRLRRNDFNQGQALSLTFDTSLVPELQLDDPEQEELVAHLLELIEDRKLTFELGVKQGVMLVVISEGGGIIKSFGETSEPLLAHESLAPLREQSPSNLRGISYASTRWRESQWTANFSQYFQNIVNQFTTALNAEGDALTAGQTDWLAQLQQDAEDLDEQLTQMTPEFGAMLSWAYATDSGLEGYSYDWNENQMLANAEPLDIVAHAGKSALAVFAVNTQDLPQTQDFIGTLLRKIPGHLARFIELVEEDDEGRGRALMAVNRGWPLVEDAYQICTVKILPSLSNETVVSMSAKWMVSELPELPPSPKPLPLPEIAVACDLEDREMFVTGCAELYEVMDRFLELVREMEPDAAPPGYVIPRPDEEFLSSGTRYFYGVIAEQFPIEGFVPQVLVGDDLVVLGYSTRQVDEMAEGNTPDLGIAWQPAGTPLAAISVTDLAGIFAAVRPWAEFGFLLSPAGLDNPVAEADGPVPTGNDLLRMWDALSYFGQVKGTSTVTADGATVSRWSWQLAN